MTAAARNSHVHRTASFLLQESLVGRIAKVLIKHAVAFKGRVTVAGSVSFRRVVPLFGILMLRVLSTNSPNDLSSWNT